MRYICSRNPYNLLLVAPFILKEITFIRQNYSKWEQCETIVENARAESPERLAELYIDVTSDLSFAQTHYPDSKITVYLNHLASGIHNEIYANKRERWSRLWTFWARELPVTMWSERRLLVASLLIFLIGVMIGVVSQYGDPTFARVIMGDSYMDMTEANIAAGNPLGVYGQMDSEVMFHSITLNNVGVAFRVFVLGLLTSIATGFGLLQNGLMIGCFDTYFAQHDLLGEALLGTMLHGTLELSAIVIAGAAGLVMGNSWFFPGTYSRLASFQRGARRGLKIVVGTVPVFVVAGFIESFLTRHTEMPLYAKLAIIGVSAAFVLFYFVLWPYLICHKKGGLNPINHDQDATRQD